ncbi:MAG TPA: site-specific integrase [Clostridia bacterium]|nr:site-specific integrase [Clostridia bacterium]
MIKNNKKIDGLCYVEDVLNKDGRKVAKVVFDNKCNLIDDANFYLKEQRGLTLSSYNSVSIKARDLCHLYNYLIITRERICGINKEKIIDFVNYLIRIESIKNMYAIENSLLKKIPFCLIDQSGNVKKINVFSILDSSSILRIVNTAISYLIYLHSEKNQLIHDDIHKLNNRKALKALINEVGIEMNSDDIQPVSEEKILTQDQIRVIMNEATKRNDYQRLLYYILEKTGMRIGEALGIQIRSLDKDSIRDIKGDIYYKDNTWCIDIIWRNWNPIDSLAKGHRSRTVYISNEDKHEFEALLLNYMRFWEGKKRINKGNWLFINNSGEKLTQNTAYIRFKRLLGKSLNEIKKHITLHSWRHTYCTNALKQGTSIEEVATQVGHTSTYTTYLIYVHNTKEDMIKVREKYTHYMEPALKYKQRRFSK